MLLKAKSLGDPDFANYPRMAFRHRDASSRRCLASRAFRHRDAFPRRCPASRASRYSTNPTPPLALHPHPRPST